MTFKSDIFEICNEIANGYDGWRFSSSGEFKNSALKHTDLIVHPGFMFDGVVPSCSVAPSAAIENKKITKLFKEIIGRKPHWTFAIQFQLESNDYLGKTSVSHIYPSKTPFTSPHGVPNYWPESFITKDQAAEYLRRVLSDGIVFLERYFDFTSEECMLQHLPTSYRWMEHGIQNTGIRGSFYEKEDGIKFCLAAIILGDFEFVEKYLSEEFKTVYPKRIQDLEKIVAAIPELKRRYSGNRGA
jgi:hypothetical protein